FDFEACGHPRRRVLQSQSYRHAHGVRSRDRGNRRSNTQDEENMTDTIASRVMRVVGGSVHAILDAVENTAPEATMAQAIREVDQAIDEVRSELGRVEAVKHLATSSLNKLNTQKETLGEQIDIAVGKGDETLARAGIAKQI